MQSFASMNADIRRRTFLGNGVAGVGLLALNSLLNPRLLASSEPSDGRWRGVVNPLHHPAKAKRIIFLYQAGGPSHLETFDNKPKLAEMHRKPMPESFTKGQQIAQLQGKPLICFGPQYGFKKFGKSGQEMCELFPHIGGIADDICIVRSMHRADQSRSRAHVDEHRVHRQGTPSMGSWLLYGLGADAEDLPGFVVLLSAGKGRPDAAHRGAAVVGGFLPSKFQGVKLNSIGDPVLYIENPPGVSSAIQRDSIDAINALNRMEHTALQDPRDPDPRRAV